MAQTRSRRSRRCELWQVSEFCGTGQPPTCATKLPPLSPEQPLELWEASERRSGRHGDVATTTSSSSARGSAGRGVRCLRPPRPLCIPDRCRCCAHCLPTVCPANPLHHTRFAVKRASTSACCRSSASSSPTASWRSIVLYYEEVPPRVRAAVGGAALARAARLLFGPADRHDRRDGLNLGRAGNAGFGARGGGKRASMMQGGGEVQA